jgi:hypothetical protein
VPLRLAFDMDGVFADMDGELVRRAEQLFGSKAIPRASALTAADSADADPADSAEELDPAVPETTPPLAQLNLTSRQQRRLWKHVQTVDNFWEALQELEPGSIARLGALAVKHRWEVIFLTKRPGSAGATSQLQTQRWLQSKGFAFPSVFVVHGSRGQIAASLGLDFVIDDRPENCLDVVVESRARAVLVWRDDEKHLPSAARRLGIGVVKSVGECLDILAQVDLPSTHKSTMIDRVLRLLGLKESAIG